MKTAYENGVASLSGFDEAVEWIGGASVGRARRNGVVRLTPLSTPLGPMVAGATDEGLCLLEFAREGALETQLTRMQRRTGALMVAEDTGFARQAAAELEAYFRGALRAFTTPLCPTGTPFQRDVWGALREIPYGETISYGEQARRIGRPRAVRAVASANGDNPIAIIVPCHRVIGASGKLTGYGGGLWRKQRLLELERGELPPGSDASAVRPGFDPE